MTNSELKLSDETMAENFALLVGELRTWLDTRDINGETIGDIRRQCFMPYDSIWNSIVRDETAAREKSTSHGLHEGDEVILRLNVDEGNTKEVLGKVEGFVRKGVVVGWSFQGRSCQTIVNPLSVTKAPHANTPDTQPEG